MLEQPEKLDEWKCEKCNESCQAMKQLVPYRFPPILVIHLKVSIYLKMNRAILTKKISAIRVEYDQYAMDEMLATYKSPDRVRNKRCLSRKKSSI